MDTIGEDVESEYCHTTSSPILVEKGCTCEFCEYEKSQTKPKLKEKKHGKDSS